MKIGFISYAHLGINDMMPGGGGVTNEMIKKALEEGGIEVDFLKYRYGGIDCCKKLKLIAGINRLAAVHSVRNAGYINELAQNYDVIICESSVNYRINHPRCINLFHFISRGYLAYGCIYPNTFAKRLKYAFFGRLEAREAKGKFNVAVSQFSRDLLLSYGVNVFKVISNAVDTEFFRPSVPATERTGCLYVGTYNYHGKGFDVLEKLAQRGVSISCITDHTAGMKSGLSYLGPVGHEQLPGIYNKHRILLFPSRFETFGLVPLEAMACGLPVVMSNVGMASELQKTIPEFVVNGHDENAIAEYLQRITAIEERYDEFSERAHQYVIDHHSYARFTEEWQHLVAVVKSF